MALLAHRPALPIAPSTFAVEANDVETKVLGYPVLICMHIM